MGAYLKRMVNSSLWLAAAVAIAAVLVFSAIHVASDEQQPEAWLYSIFGTTFRVDDPETLVLPSTHVHLGDVNRQVADVKDFTLCARWPTLKLLGDEKSRRACLLVGSVPNDSMMIAVKGEGVNQPVPSRQMERGFGFVLRRWVDYDGAGTRIPTGETYVAGDDLHGLHVYYPTGPKLSPLSYVMFWQGSDIYHVDTWINCLGFLPETRKKLRRCIQSFYLPPDAFSGHSVRVDVWYHEKWLPDWHAIEANVQRKLLSMRVN